jgi:antitoxin (DNA-binding transcriptional repressor) of toxin-antitoxin stability system
MPAAWHPASHTRPVEVPQHGYHRRRIVRACPLGIRRRALGLGRQVEPLRSKSRTTAVATAATMASLVLGGVLVLVLLVVQPLVPAQCLSRWERAVAERALVQLLLLRVRGTAGRRLGLVFWRGRWRLPVARLVPAQRLPRRERAVTERALVQLLLLCMRGAAGQRLVSWRGRRRQRQLPVARLVPAQRLVGRVHLATHGALVPVRMVLAYWAALFTSDLLSAMERLVDQGS